MSDDLPRDPFFATNELVKQAIVDGVENRRINRDLVLAVRGLVDETHWNTKALRELCEEIRLLREEREAERARSNGHTNGALHLAKP